jgi:hypothetical protein
MGFNSGFKGLNMVADGMVASMNEKAKYTIDRLKIVMHKCVIIIIISNLSNDRSKASSKMIPPYSAI